VTINRGRLAVVPARVEPLTSPLVESIPSRESNSKITIISEDHSKTIRPVPHQDGTSVSSWPEIIALNRGAYAQAHHHVDQDSGGAKQRQDTELLDRKEVCVNGKAAKSKTQRQIPAAAEMASFEADALLWAYDC